MFLTYSTSRVLELVEKDINAKINVSNSTFPYPPPPPKDSTKEVENKMAPAMNIKIEDLSSIVLKKTKIAEVMKTFPSLQENISKKSMY